MSTGLVDEQVFARWEANNLGQHFAGGIWNTHHLPKQKTGGQKVVYPLVRFVPLGSARVGGDSDGHLVDTNFQLSIYHSVANGEELVATTRALAKILIAAYNDDNESSVFALPNAEGQMLLTTYVTDNYEEIEENLLHWWITFRGSWSRHRT